MCTYLRDYLGQRLADLSAKRFAVAQNLRDDFNRREAMELAATDETKEFWYQCQKVSKRIGVCR
jgi:hypothetical protein